MKPASSWLARLVLCRLLIAGPLMLAFAVKPALAVSFEPASQYRSVQIYGDLSSFNFETQQSSSAVFNDKNHSLPNGWDPLRMGMNISLDEGDCFGQGIASQSLIAGGESIYFFGIADVNISGSSSYPLRLAGSGSAVVDVAYDFKLDEARSVNLMMNSEVGDFRDEDYSFSIIKNNEQIVWASTGIIDEDGQAQRSFSQELNLGSGIYTIKAQLRANSYLSGDVSFAGRSWAEFTISVVPEPSSFWLLATGLVAIAVARKRLQES